MDEIQENMRAMKSEEASLDKNTGCRCQSGLCCHEFVHASGSGESFPSSQHVADKHLHSRCVSKTELGEMTDHEREQHQTSDDQI